MAMGHFLMSYVIVRSGLGWVSRHARPFAVTQYCWFLLRGAEGRVISTRPCERSCVRARLKLPVREAYPSAFSSAKVACGLRLHDRSKA